MTKTTDESNHDAGLGGGNGNGHASPPRWSVEHPERTGELDSVLMGGREAGRDELLERIFSDQVRRWRTGQLVPAETYLVRYPALQTDDNAAFELIYGEYLLREERGEPPSAEELQWRFPRYADRLRRQVDLHEVLNSGDLAPDGTSPAGTSRAAETGDAPEPSGPFVAPGFRILGELGRGGMGTVYKARQVRLNRIVAIKVLRAGAYADAAAVARFQAEAEAAARFQHPNIIQVFEVGEHEGAGYLVLEYAAGGGLDHRLKETLQDPRSSAQLIETLARAIHFAHVRGIIHRDLKPANVLLTEEGVPKIADFGLAKLLERDDALTGHGEILGTPSYMAPEQVRGQTDQIAPATDVYSLGAILYEMLTGRPPFKGTTPLSTLEQVSSQEPLAPGKLQRHLPRDLETICMKCLEKEPGRRYPTALELAEDLERFLHGRPILARPTPVWDRLAKWARRRPAGAAAVVGLFTLSFLLLGGGVYYNHRLHAQMLTAQNAERRSAVDARNAFEQRNLALKTLDQLIYDVQEKLAQTPATRSLRRSLLDTAIRGLEELERSTAGSATNLSQAVAYEKLGDIYRIIGQAPAARQHYGRSLRIGEELLAGAPTASPSRRSSTRLTWDSDGSTSGRSTTTPPSVNFARPSRWPRRSPPRIPPTARRGAISSKRTCSSAAPIASPATTRTPTRGSARCTTSPRSGSPRSRRTTWPATCWPRPCASWRISASSRRTLARPGAPTIEPSRSAARLSLPSPRTTHSAPTWRPPWTIWAASPGRKAVWSRPGTSSARPRRSSPGWWPMTPRTSSLGSSC